ncbi:MAG: ribonuclease HII [Tidjanibacter sp.]|nr:ribonuclease HII [Tidjanibacter sp.]
MLEISYKKECLEAGCDEAGRGCLAGPVVAAAVILPPDYHHPLLNDSKQMTAAQRQKVRDHIKEHALAWAVAEVSAEEIDHINILKASFEAMQRAVERLSIRPEHLLIDGNRFYPRLDIPFRCEVKGDARFANIAAASVLAKTYRDEYMAHLAEEFPAYGWERNAGYPTKQHREAIARHGLTPHHRLTFIHDKDQLSLF